MDAADSLSTARALRASGELAAAAEILQAELEVSQKPEHVERVGAELASLLEDELGDLIAAAEVWQRVLDLIPDHRPALDALERIFMSGGMFYELALIYERRLALEGDPDARASCHQRVAVIHEELLDDPYAAIDHLLCALDLRPDDRQLLDTLARLYDQEGIEGEARTRRVASPHVSDAAGAAPVISPQAEDEG